MKILIVSDTHGRNENLKRVIEKVKPLDLLIHLGDLGGSENVIPDLVNEGCETEMVQGNNDFFARLDREKDIMIGRYRTLLTHGDYYNVSLGAETLEEEAGARGFDIAMYGHTHRPFYEIYKKEGGRDLLVLNPGSLSCPRQDGHKPSYMVMELDEKGEAHVTLNFL